MHPPVAGDELADLGDHEADGVIGYILVVGVGRVGDRDAAGAQALHIHPFKPRADHGDEAEMRQGGDLRGHGKVAKGDQRPRRPALPASECSQIGLRHVENDVSVAE